MVEKTPITPEAPPVAGTKANANCNQVILDHFWHITGPSDDRRCSSVKVIVQTLQRQAAQADDRHNDLAYCLDRLVRGLTSTREYARHGFCVLLTQLLMVFPDRIDLAELVDRAEKAYETFDKKSTPESAIAWTLFYSCLLKSGSITLNVEQNILSKMFETLYAIGCQRAYVELIICELMEMFFEIFKDDHEMFEKIVIEPIKSMEDHGNTLFKANLICTAHRIGVDTDNNLFSRFLKQKIYEPSSQDFGMVTKLFRECTKYHPNVHPVIGNLITVVKTVDPKHTQIFFQTLVEDMFKVNMEKTWLGFEIIPFLLQQANADHMKAILSPDVVRILIQTLSNKKHPLRNSALNLSQHLINYSGTIQNDGAKQFEFAKCFIEKPGSINFDELSKTKTLFGILKNFNSQAIIRWVKMLRDLMVNQENVTATDFFRVKCLQQMAQLLKSYNGDSDFLRKFCRFFFLYAYFNVDKRKKHFHEHKDLLVEFKHPITDQLRQQFANAFKMVFSHLCTLETETAAKLPKQIEIYSEFTGLMDSLIRKDGIALADQNVPLKKLRATVIEMNEKLVSIPADKNEIKCLVFRLLYHHFMLELMENLEEIVAILPDFNECAIRAFAPPKKQRSVDEPFWSDVLVDLFISLITKSKHIKNIILMVFKHICPFITVSGIQSLIEAFSNDETIELQDSDDNGDEEEDDNDDEVIEENETPKMEKDNDSDEENNEDSDSDDDDDDLLEEDGQEEVEEQFKMDVCQALGSAAANQGDEDSAEEGLSDSEMFKLDEKLAAVFRKKFGDKKRMAEKKNLIQSFKLRVLDLIRIVVEHHPKLHIRTVFTILSSLIDFLRTCHSSKSMFPVTNRCVQVLKQISKSRPEMNEVTQDQFEEMLESLLQLQSKCTNANLHGALISLTGWLVTLAKKQSLDLKFIADRMEQALKDLFQRANNETKARLFVVILPQLVPTGKFQESSYFSILEQYCGDQNVRVFKRHVAQELMAALCPEVAAATRIKGGSRKKKKANKKFKSQQQNQN